MNHSLTEAVNLGATAHSLVEEDCDNDLMEQVQAPTVYGTFGRGSRCAPGEGEVITVQMILWFTANNESVTKRVFD